MQTTASRERHLPKECCHNFTKSPPERKSPLPTRQFTAASLTIARICTQAQCPSGDEWIRKLWYTHSVAEDLATPKKEILPFVTACVDLQITVLRGISP